MRDLQEARRRLEAERDRLLEVRRGLEADVADDRERGSELSSLDQHQADAGSELFEREKERSILAGVAGDLADVTDALERVARDEYGVCETCGEPIADERLEAVPATRFCAVHEALWEGRSWMLRSPDDLFGVGWSIPEHPGFLPADDELDAIEELSSEEGAMHVTRPEPATRRRARPAQRARGEEEAMASRDREWPLTVVFTEDDRTTRADVILDVGGRHHHGWGTARRAPADPDVPRIGEEVAAARALSRLAHDLIDAAGADISELEHHPVHLHV
jgi:RNA polymerase-binding transcription factor DksA